jgi:hypothetical protein
VINAYAFGEHVHVVTSGNKEEKIRELLHEEKAPAEIFPVEPAIEDCFIQLMQNNG